MNRKVLTALLTAAASTLAFSTPALAETVIKAADAALDGVMLKDTDAEALTDYDEDSDSIMGIGEFSTASYTVPAGISGTYDIYLEVSRAANAFTAGASPVTISINGGKVYVPSVNMTPCTMDQMGLTGGDVTYMNDMGVFLLKAGVELKENDVITIGGVPGFEFLYEGAYGSSMPAIGDLMLYEAGTEVMVGYADNQKSSVVAEAVEGDPLSGLSICWLGSSVTYGQGAGGYSMADAIVDNHPGTVSYKYTISGTTLADCAYAASLPTDGEGSHGSYVNRLKMLDTDQKYDLFVCQLSTNDATNGIPMGEMIESKNLEDFNTATVIGAMEYIIAYVAENWNCPFMFYTGTKYDSEQYEEMVGVVLALQEKWGFGVVDLWNNEEMNAVSEEDYAVYMKDPIHPTLDGYVKWWTPAFEQGIADYLG